MFKKLLIANRGEIACRIIRTCRKLGIATVAVYSEADAEALHVLQADEKVLLGPPQAAQSYLLADRIVEACRSTGAEAVHPGYGFLSERAAFAKALAEAGIAFVGPPVGAIEAMGDKIESKRLARQAKVSTVPGTLDAIAEPADRARGRARDRLPGHGQGLGRRRRQGHADRPGRPGAARRARARPLRGALLVRRRPRVHREVRGRAAPHRDPGAGRPARQHRLSGRARMLDPAAPPEGDRGGALAVPGRGDAPRHGRAGRGPGPGRRLPLGRHGRVHRRPRPQLLLPRDEHPAAGRAPGDRAGHRRRSGRADDQGRGRRAAAVRPGRRAAGRLGDRGPRLRRGPAPRLPAVDRPPGALPGARRARASASTAASSRAARCRCTTTR